MLESGLEATHAPVARLPTRSRGLWPLRAHVVGAARASDKSRMPHRSVISTERRVESFADDLNTRRDQRLGFNIGCIVPTLVKIFPQQPSLIPDVHRFAYDSIFCYAHKGESHAL
ncbi:hypothetical protein V6N13_081018 [Hibiscus sabdariffa]